MRFKHTLALVALLTTKFTHAQISDTVTTNQVIISAARTQVSFNDLSRNVTVITPEEIKNAPVHSVDDLLDYAMNVDVRSRSTLGVQSDISIRGGSFEQTLILLNGVPLSDPQTGHHSMNLPVSLNQIERIEILQGGGSRVFGEKAFAGAINIITKKETENSFSGSVAGGDFGYGNYSANVNGAYKNFSVLGGASYAKSDGYISNTDFDITNFFAQANYSFKNGSILWNGGYTSKNFGAQNFYTSLFPYQYEGTKTRFSSIVLNYSLKKFDFKVQACNRRNRDKFELYRETDGWYQRSGTYFIHDNDTAPSWYTGHNYHVTDAAGAGINIAYNSPVGKISIGADGRTEKVQSNVLGDKLNSPIHVKGEDDNVFYTKEKKRDNLSVYAEDNFSYKKLSVSAGIMININSYYGTEFFPGIDVSYGVIPMLRLYTSVNRSVRFPTFTDLYYNRGGAVGSINLKPEDAINYEGGIKLNSKYVKGNISYFRRDAQNLIDWVRLNGDDTTRATNLTEVVFNGVDMQLNIPTEPFFGKDAVVEQFRINLTYTDANKSSGNFESNYVLDFLKWKGTFSFHQRISDFVFADWYINYQQRKGGYFKPGDTQETEYKSFSTVDVRLSHQTRRLCVYMEASNLFDASYVDFGNIGQPGRWFKAGCNFTLTK